MIINQANPQRCTCSRCGYSWLRRQEAAPQQCPRCRSPYWNRPRKRTYLALSNSADRWIAVASGHDRKEVEEEAQRVLARAAQPHDLIVVTMSVAQRRFHLTPDVIYSDIEAQA